MGWTGNTIVHTSVELRGRVSKALVPTNKDEGKPGQMLFLLHLKLLDVINYIIIELHGLEGLNVCAQQQCSTGAQNGSLWCSTVSFDTIERSSCTQIRVKIKVK